MQSGAGRFEARIVSPRLFETRLEGYMDTALADWLMAQLEQWLALGGQRVVVFHDWEAVTDYDAPIRMKFTEFGNRHRARFERLHILVKSKTAMWGIRIYNNLTGGFVTTYGNRQEFEALRESARHDLR